MNDFWTACLERLKEIVAATPSIYRLWISTITVVDWNPKTGRLKLAAPQQKVQLIRQAYTKIIQQAAGTVAGRTVTVTFVSEEDAEKQEAPAAPAPAPAPARAKGKAATDRESMGLIERFTFDTYVSGSANQLAVAAAQHVASTPGHSYNPLYIYGGVGLGKTHLMQAIGHKYLDLHPSAKVRCVTAQNFINEYTQAVRESGAKGPGVLEQFDERYRNLDLLLIDDVQSLSGAKGSQAQFFRAFEALVPHNKQVVLTSDTYARGLKDIEPRLVSRLAQGLTVAIEPPEYEMRLAILQNKAQRLGIDFPTDVASFIAKRLKSNIRELEGALQQVVAYLQFQPQDERMITVDMVKRVLRDRLEASDGYITIEAIQKTVADYYKLKVADMHSKRRPANIARPRQIAMYLSKQMTNKSLVEIGESFGGRDHATVLHAVRKIEQERASKADLNHELHVLEQMIRG